ncbi:MAG: hypothetical protein FJX74_03185 [Armatimonadetes bacterium]|nr:hypothetical protein [Armatimonadota bacterium]
MRKPWTGLLLPALVIAACSAVAQDAEEGGKPRFFFEGGKAPAAPEGDGVGFSFEADADLAAWQALDAEALIERDTAPGAAFAGEGCLRMTCVAREGAFQQLTARPPTVTEAATLAFGIRTDLPTNLSFGVVEGGGAFYQQFAAIPGGQWTWVSVPLASLVLSQDTQDASGRLEPEQIAEIRLADLANLPGPLGDALGRKTGVQRLCLDEVVLSSATEGTVAGAGDPRLFVEGFEGESVMALAIGGAALERVAEGDGHALRVVADGRASRWQGCVLAVGQLDLRAASGLSLRLGASEGLVVNVTLEERDGSKYSQRIGVAADAPSEKTIPLDAMILETDSADENGRLDRDQARVLVIVADMARAVRLPAWFSLDDVRFE